jgi:hypothetical protein
MGAAENPSDSPGWDSNEPQEPKENVQVSDPGGTDSGTPADAGTVEALAAALQTLSPADRARLAALLLANDANPDYA